MTPLPLSAVRDRLLQNGRLYEEFLRVPALSAGFYRLAAGSSDPQQPHNEDEVYYVIAGTARVQIEEESFPVAAGDVIFVEKLRPHHFFEITADLELLVFFAPAET